MSALSRTVAASLLFALLCPPLPAEEPELTSYQAVHSELAAQSRLKALGREILVQEVKEPSTEWDKMEHRAETGDRTVSVGRAWDAPAERLPMRGNAPFTMDLAFQSINLDDASAVAGYLFTPPDTMGVVGPTEFFMTQNGNYRVHDKATGTPNLALDVAASDFWVPAVDPSDSGGGDPRVRFDRINDRWVVIAFDTTGVNRLLIAVSGGPTLDAGTVWTQYYIIPADTVGGAANAGCFADYPMLGVDRNAIYLSANMFCPGPTTTAVFVIPLNQLPGGGGNASAITTAFTGLLQSVPIWSPMPADNTDPAATTGYVIGHDANSDTTLKLGKIANPGGAPGTPTVTWTDITVSDKNDGYSSNSDTTGGVPYPGVPSPTGAGTNWGLDPLGFRPLGGAQVTNGRLWTAMTSSVDGPGGTLQLFPATGDRHSVVFFEIDVNANTLVQDGNVYDTVTARGPDPMHLFMGSVNVNGQGHAVVGGTGNNTTTMAPSAVWAARLATDPPGQFGQPEDYLLGIDTGNMRQSFETDPRETRWGDYSQVSIDPCDDMTFYAIQEYQDSPAVATGGNWATGVARILAPAPAVAAADPAVIASGQASVAVTFTGTGFYSPPATGMPACRTDLEVDAVGPVEGDGLNVNSVTLVNPGEISVDFSSVGTADGDFTIEITNPDGQLTSISLAVSASIFEDGFESGDTTAWSSTSR